MTTAIEPLAKALGKAVCRCSSEECNLPLNDAALCRVLIRLLAEGQPVPLDTLAQVIGRPRAEVATAIHRSMNIEWDEAGNLVGAGLTLRPTPHRVLFDGRTLYTWCALDALIYPPFLGRTAQVESPCAATGTPIRLTVSPQAVESVVPGEAVVSIVAPPASPDVRASFCNHVHFFRSAQAADSWLAQHSGAVLLSVADAYALGQRLTHQRDRSASAVQPN
ncbi:MAG: organomercurial lyase MerB [Ardenticatenaceae bacterium]